MSNRVDFEQVEQLTAQLPPSKQLKLIAHVCEKLNMSQTLESNEGKSRQERLAQVDVWLAECDSVAEGIEGEFDSAEDIRIVREERANCL